MAKNIEEIKAALASYGITGVKNVYYNPSYEQLFKDEMDPALTGYDKGVLTELDAVNVMTGIYTGRSPKDKYIVMDAKSKDTVWWTTEGYKNDNHPMSEEIWGKVKDLAKSNSAARTSMWSTLSAVPTRTPAWPSASSWRWHGKPTSC